MDCIHVRDRLSTYLDGEVRIEADAIGAHLERCGACRALFQQLQRTGEIFRQFPALPEGVIERVVARVRNEGPQLRRARSLRHFTQRVAVAASLFAVVLWASVLASRPGPGIPDSGVGGLIGEDGLSVLERQALYAPSFSEGDTLRNILASGVGR